MPPENIGLVHDLGANMGYAAFKSVVNAALLLLRYSDRPKLYPAIHVNGAEKQITLTLYGKCTDKERDNLVAFVWARMPATLSLQVVRADLPEQVSTLVRDVVAQNADNDAPLILLDLLLVLGLLADRDIGRQTSGRDVARAWARDFALGSNRVIAVE